MNARRILLALLITVMVAAGASAQSQQKRTGWGAALDRINSATRAQLRAQPNRTDEQSSAKDGDDDDRDDRDDRACKGRRDLTGSWVVTNTFSDGFSFHSLFTFGEDATFVGATQGDISLTEDEPYVGTAQHGAWQCRGDDRFALKFLLLYYDPTSVETPLLDTARVRFRIELLSKNRWRGEFTVDVILPDGTTFRDVASGTSEARRIRVK